MTSRLPLRFWRLIESLGVDACWRWKGRIDPAGYARFGDGRHGTVYAHRLLWMELRGPIPDGMEIDHVCRNRACVNPAHHECVTLAVNRARRIWPPSPTVCPQGHPYDEANTYRTRRGFRACRECTRIATRRWRQRQAS